MALAVAGAPLALMMTQLATIGAAADWVRGLATLSIICFVYCCVWQVYIVNYATYWLAAERTGDDGAALPGRGLLRAFKLGETYTEEGLIRLIRRSRLHYSLAYWIGGTAGLAVAFGVIWA